MIEIAIPIQIVLIIGVPILAGWLLVRRYGTDGTDHLRIFLGGVLSYAVAQAVLLVLSQAIGMIGLPSVPTAWQPLVTAIAYGVGIGVFEELARFAVLRLWLRDVRSWAQGLMLGVGHGGAESALSGVMVLIWYMTMQSLRSGVPASENVTPEEKASLDKLAAAFWNQPWPDAILGGVQQVCVIALAVGLATIVMRVFLTGKLIYLPAAMGLHALASTTLVLLNQVGMVYSTIVAVAFGIVGLLIARAFAVPPPALQVAAIAQAPLATEDVSPARKTRPQKKRAKKSQA